MNMTLAVYNGDMETIKRLRNQGCPWDAWTCANTAWNGHLNVLQWLRTQGCPWDEKTCASAAFMDHLHVLKWARSQGCPWDALTCSGAAVNEDLEMLKWLRSQDPPDGRDSYRRPCPWDERTCSSAAEYGHLHVLKWLRSQNPPDGRDSYRRPDGSEDSNNSEDSYGRPCPWDEQTCFRAATCGHLHILKWALEHDCPYNEYLHECITFRREYYDAIYWLCKHNYIGSADIQTWIRAVDDQTSQLSLPSELIGLIKQYV